MPVTTESATNFKSPETARHSNIPVLGRTRLLASAQQVATQNNFPLLSLFLPQNLVPWLLHYFKGIFHGKVKPYPTYSSDGQDGIYPLSTADGGAEIRISIVGDWGTGTEEAFEVGQQVQDFSPDYTIHLGDVYYVGDDPEVKENFLGEQVANSPYTPVVFPHGNIGTFAMLGNHEMYTGGEPYFTEMLAACGPGLGQKQKASFFCLETHFWRILALDTGYNSVGVPILGSIPMVNKLPFLGANCKLQDELITWLQTNVKPKELKKPTLLLTHHQYFSAFGDGSYPVPAKQLSEFFSGQTVVWIWGHEHRLAIYEQGSPDGQIQCYGRCLGHGGMPIEEVTPKANNPALAFYDNRFNHPIGNGDMAGFNGFVNLTLEDNNLTLDYRDLTNQSLFVESFLGHADGTLEHSFQTPVPVLVPPPAA
jgi:Calcineurin-like phosphoesterase